MNLNPLWKKAVVSSTLSDSEKEALYQIDPDALRQSVSALQKQLDDAENAQLSETEKLQKELTKVRDERETLDRNYRALFRQHRIAAIARKFGCAEPDYLDFLAARSSVDLEDDAAVAAMVGQLQKSHPFAFVSQLKSGGGAGSPETLEKQENSLPRDPESRIGILMQTIGKVPFQE